MIAMALVGVALGAVLFALVVVLVRPQRSTLVQLGQFYAHYRGPQTVTAPAVTAKDVRERIGQRIAVELARHKIGYGGLRSDLALTGESFETVMGRKAIAAACWFLGGVLAGSLLQSYLGLPTGAPLAVGVIAAVAAFMAPDYDTRKEAKARRAVFTEQLSIFFDLVSLKMAGHAAAASALPEAAERGGGWPMILIRDTLFRARQTNANEWDALSKLGERIGVADLRDLGALVKLVADDGAQVRDTLTARAASMRRARLADEEGSADERNQSMRLAQILIMIGFAIFVGYPAFVNISF